MSVGTVPSICLLGGKNCLFSSKIVGSRCVRFHKQLEKVLVFIIDVKRFMAM